MYFVKKNERILLAHTYALTRGTGHGNFQIDS